MSEGQLNAEFEQYLQAAAMNVAPPPIISDPLIGDGTPIEQLLRVLGLAANDGDPADNADSLEAHAERDAQTTSAAGNFAAQDEQAAAQMAQQMPQLASGIAGALAGALGSALAPIAQIPQQIAQSAQQVLQARVAQQTGADPAMDAGLADGQAIDDLGDPGLDDPSDLGSLDSAPGDGDFSDSTGFGGGGPGAQPPVSAPTAVLGPPAIPSAGTSPSSAMATPPGSAAPVTATPSTGAGMSGLPMVPPGTVQGGAGADRDTKADTRRVSVPPVRNGAPVQGRLTAPAGPPVVTKRVEGKPVAARRIVVATEPDDS